MAQAMIMNGATPNSAHVGNTQVGNSHHIVINKHLGSLLVQMLSQTGYGGAQISDLLMDILH